MNTDQPHRKYRYIEVLDPSDLKRSRRTPWKLVSGWLALAMERFPGRDGAILEGDYLAHLPDGSTFKEVSFKTEHHAVEDVLEDWALSAGRRWGRVDGGEFIRSDSEVFASETIRYEEH